MSNNTSISIITFILVIMIAIGFSYAYFSANVEGEESSTTLTVTGGSLSIAVNGGNSINVQNIIPGPEAKTGKTITLTGTNTTDLLMPYSMYLVVESNTFSDNAISYTLESTNNDDNGKPILEINNPVGVATGGSVVNLGQGYFSTGNGVVHTYILNIYFLETEEDQNEDQGKAINGYVTIDSEAANVSSELINNEIKYEPNGDEVYSKSKSVKVSPLTGLNEINENSLKYLWSPLTSGVEESEIINSVSINEEITTPVLTGNYYLYILSEDMEGNATVSRSETYKLDNQAPSINLIGGETMTIFVGDNYIEQATASDVQDGNLTSLIEITGTVDTNTVGTYEITYRVSDSSGNTTEKIRTVVVETPYLKTKILGPNNSNVKAPLTIPGRMLHGTSFNDKPNLLMNVSTTYRGYYWTYGTGYTRNANGTHNLTGVSTVRYNTGYSTLVGKYLVSVGETGNGSSTNVQKTTTNLQDVIRVESATSTNLTYRSEKAPTTETEAVLASRVDDYGTSYYFRGTVENNYVVFANMCWRIVRVVGDGSIKLVLYNYSSSSCTTSGTSNAFARYSGATYTTAFNYNSTQNADIGFMYGTRGSSSYALEHANNSKSYILQRLETWYNSKLLSYESNLADTIWCNDKSMSTASTYLGHRNNVTYYKAYQRLYTRSSALPSLVCPNDANGGKLSKFTVDDTVKGNGRLTKKIGLLTADEVAFAGGIPGIGNKDYYLYKNASSEPWWLLSSGYYDYDSARGGLVTEAGIIHFFYNVSVVFALRPSISLVSTTIISGGIGTASNPYVIST